MKTTGSIEIEKPIDEVFDYTINHTPEWSDIVVSDEVLLEQPGEVGTTFRTVTEERGQRMEFRGKVTQSDPPNSKTVTMEGEQFDLWVEYRFAPLATRRTRVTQTSVVTPKGGLKVIFFLFGWMMKAGGCRALEKELANLKGKLEGDRGDG